MKIIGYKFTVIEDNGDCDEWWRETHLESPIYTSKTLAEEALLLCKRKMLNGVKKDIQEYFACQYRFEVKNGRSINGFFEQCQRSLMRARKEVLTRMSCAEIIPLYAKDTATDEYTVYSIGN